MDAEFTKKIDDCYERIADKEASRRSDGATGAGEDRGA
jgi:hypothetical protein